jgi:Family of unknown function (DUF5367)
MGDIAMSTTAQIRCICFGFALWLAGTAVYRVIGSYCFEGSALQYWLNVDATEILYVATVLGFMKWQGVERKDWLQGAICVALPGMLGEVPVLSGFAELMTNMQPETAGRYAALLFGGYALLIGLAGWLSLKPTGIAAKPSDQDEPAC